MTRPALMLLILFFAACTRAETLTPPPSAMKPAPPLLVQQAASSPTPALPPTYTLVPTLAPIDAEITRLYQQGTPLAHILYSRTGEPGWALDDNLTYAPTEMAALAWMTLGQRTLSRELRVASGTEVRLAGAQYSPSYIYAQFRYMDAVDGIEDEYEARIPFALCALRDAGFTAATVELHIEAYSPNGRLRSGKYFCLSPEVINSLNCTSPAQTNMRRLGAISGECY